MRIKRQRRKLRGKYSGNCLSCAAKWSKCWYIASIENQSEWEARLSKIVTPGADEVCFQCWDAKIRTSPKRKMHFKEELPLNDTVSLENTNTSTPYLRPSKRVDRNKRRVLNEDYTYDFSTTSPQPSQQTSNDSKLKDDGFEELDDFIDENDDEIDSGVSDEGIILDEETAVFLLSTAFRTSPYINNLNLFKIDASFSDDDEIIDFSKESEEDMKSRKRGAYYCGKCGKLKKGHVCHDQSDPSHQSPDASPSLQPSDLPLEPTFQMVQSLMPSLIAQPVGS